MDILCRVCIKKAIKFTSLNTKIENSSNLTFFDFLNKCTSLNACKSDKLPQSLCSICTCSIKAFYSFVKLAEKSNIILREALKNSIARGRYNDNRENSCEEIIIKNEKIEEGPEDFNKEDSFRHQTRENSTGSSLYVLDFVKEEPRVSESTPIVDFKDAEINESYQFPSNLDHLEGNIEEPDDILSCIDGDLASIDAEHSDSDDRLSSFLKRRLIKNRDGTHSQINFLSKAHFIHSNVKKKAGEIKAKCKEVIKEEEPHSSSDGLSCEICHRVFKTKIEYENHIRIIRIGHGSTKQVSNEANDDSLKPHTRGHTENTYKCIECDMVFSDRDEFRTHCRNHIYREKKKYKCSICGKRLNHASSLKKHMEKHSRKKHDKKHECEICSKQFSTKQYLNIHMENHDGNMKKCDQCGKEFNNSLTLRLHMKRHINPKPFKCGNCGKSFSRKDSHIWHMEICKGAGNSSEETHRKGRTEKTYKCVECDMVFNDEDEFRTHCRNHINGNKHECNICGKMFARPNYLYNHLVVHEEKKKYKCSICGKGLKHSTSRWGHMKMHSGEKPFECEICGKKFCFKGRYNKHLRIHTRPHKLPADKKDKKKNECEICSKIFRSKSYLNIHMENHNGILKKCDQCDKEFKNSLTLRKHMKWHINPKPFKCANCGRLFPRRYRLTKHMTICKPVDKSKEETVTIGDPSCHSKGNEIIVKIS